MPTRRLCGQVNPCRNCSICVRIGIKPSAIARARLGRLRHVGSLVHSTQPRTVERNSHECRKSLRDSCQGSWLCVQRSKTTWTSQTRLEKMAGRRQSRGSDETPVVLPESARCLLKLCAPCTSRCVLWHPPPSQHPTRRQPVCVGVIFPWCSTEARSVKNTHVVFNSRLTSIY